MGVRRGMAGAAKGDLVMVTTREAIRAQTIKILNGVLADLSPKFMRAWLVDALEHDATVQQAVREFLKRESGRRAI